MGLAYAPKRCSLAFASAHRPPRPPPPNALKRGAELAPVASADAPEQHGTGQRSALFMGFLIEITVRRLLKNPWRPMSASCRSKAEIQPRPLLRGISVFGVRNSETDVISLVAAQDARVVTK